MGNDNEPAIVFIHLGVKVPKWLLPNILRVKQQFPNSTVLFVSDNDSLIDKYSRLDIETFRYESDFRDVELGRNTEWDLSFRQKYWLETTRRFLAIAAAQKLLNCPVLHVESDVLISPTLDLSAFKLLDKPLCFGLAAPGLGVGALVYSRDPESSQHLASFVITKFTEVHKINDMQILGAFAKQHGDRVSILPTAPHVNSVIFNAKAEPEFRLATSELFSNFGGIFDIATIGQFLAGKDPRNHKGFREIYTVPVDHCINPAAVKFCTSGEDGLSFQEEELDSHVAIHSLHVHSKDLRFFRSDAHSKILSKRVSQYRGTPLREFSSWGFREAAFSYLSRRFHKILKGR